MQCKLEKAVAVRSYALTSANDSAGRDPKDWTLQGSQNGTTWTDLDKRSGEVFPQRTQSKEYKFENTTAYQYYRLNVTANAGEPLTQLAELRLFGHRLRASARGEGAEGRRGHPRPRSTRRTRGCRSPCRGPTGG